MKFCVFLTFKFLAWFSWNNGLREAVVTDAFLFLSTFFIQVLNTYYKGGFMLSTRLCFYLKYTCV